MNGSSGYAVYFFPQALEALGDAIKPYLHEGPGGPHVLCHEVDTGGSLLEMTLLGTSDSGASMQLELMVPTSMVRMIVSAQSDGGFGFRPRDAVRQREAGSAPTQEAKPAPAAVAAQDVPAPAAGPGTGAAG